MKKKELLKTIIREFQTRDLPDIIPRDIVIPVNSGKIISLVGPRRSGKTYLLYQLIKGVADSTSKENIVYINFEDERLDLTKYDLDVILQAYGELYPSANYKNTNFFFDEIQNVDGWEKFIRRVYDTISKKIFITGSNSKLLGDEIATSLRGRTIRYEVLPLSFREFLRFKNISFSNPHDLNFNHLPRIQNPKRVEGLLDSAHKLERVFFHHNWQMVFFQKPNAMLAGDGAAA